MLELLVTQLGKVGLSLNTSKTKFFTTEEMPVPMYVDVASGMVEVLMGRDTHKYLSILAEKSQAT